MTLTYYGIGSPLARTIYRSLLRWCQQDLVKRVPFTLPVLSANLDQYWVEHNSSGAAITGADGAKEFIRRIFRKESAENLDAGFEALRELDKFSRDFLVNLEAQRKAREDR